MIKYDRILEAFLVTDYDHLRELSRFSTTMFFYCSNVNIYTDNCVQNED